VDELRPLSTAVVPVIDSHQHFWDPESNLLAGLVDKYASLRRRFLPADLQPLLELAGVSRTIAVQADPTSADTRTLMRMSVNHPFIAGVVGWIDPECVEPAAEIRCLRQSPGATALAGIRINARDHPDSAWLSQPGPSRAVTAIIEAGLVCEFLLRPENGTTALRELGARDRGIFVVDHMMTIPARRSERSTWQRQIKAIAPLPNLYLKISGFIDEPGPAGWKPTDFQFAIDYVLETWDLGRLLFGTDWPVSTLSRPYAAIVDWTRSALGGLTEAEQSAILGWNAERCYGLAPE
jgi:L-fuconolactonase